MITLSASVATYAPVVSLEKLLSRRLLSYLRVGSFVVAIASTVGALVTTYFYAGAYAPLFTGVALISAASWCKQMFLFSYHNSFYFRGLNSLIGLDDAVTSGATYDVAKAVLKYPSDVSRAFASAPLGETVLLRAGLGMEAVALWLENPRPYISAETVTLPEHELFSLIGLGKYLLAHDSSFRDLMTKNGITEDTFLGALRWVIGSYHQEKRRLRWWSKDNLSRTTGLGRDWAFGVPYTLERFSKPVDASAVFSNITGDSTYATERIAEIETALARTQGANVLILGEAGVGKIDLVLGVAERMRLGQSLASVSGKQIIALDTDRLFATSNTKQSFEATLTTLLEEAEHAGNTIIVIENLSTVIREAAAIGVFLPELLDRYLAFPEVQIIATDTPGAYHANLEPLGAFVRRFVEVLVESPDPAATTRLLQRIAEKYETTHHILFTYDGLHAITLAADRYIVEGVMPDKAIDLLGEVAATAESSDRVVITAELVYTLVGEKTGVPAGPIRSEERDLLLHLEDRLHQQVIGQHQAIAAIARAMRRARAGIGATDKPIGSFLFLGPTGVGKTETAKALARIFFGAEEKLERLDMSEYSGTDALSRILGDGDTPGTLPNLLREHPYCVLLLDEFEKANRAVHDLFLQILDEGVFTDARGGRVNARNTIIIATSNAGSELIRQTVEQRQNLATLEQAIIDNIIKAGVYRPELVNRFDDTIIFEPLTLAEQTEVAQLLLGGLYERIRDRGYELMVEPELLHILVEKGYNPEFGARPMMRVLQDVIEEKVAKKIIAGTVGKGSSIVLGRADFSEEELAVG